MLFEPGQLNYQIYKQTIYFFTYVDAYIMCRKMQTQDLQWNLPLFSEHRDCCYFNFLKPKI